MVQASQRNALFTASVDTITKSRRQYCSLNRHWKTWELEVTPICFPCCCGYWDTVLSPELKEFSKLTAPVSSPVVAPWIPLSGSTTDVPTQTQPGLLTFRFLILWIHPFFHQHRPHPGAISGISQGLYPEVHLETFLALVLSGKCHYQECSFTLFTLVGWFPLRALADFSRALTQISFAPAHQKFKGFLGTL